QLRKLIRSESHALMLIRSERHRLTESASGVYYRVDRAAYLVVGRVPKLRDCSKFSGVERSISEMRIHRRIAQSDRAAGSEEDFAPQPHTLVGRRGIPIHEVDAQVIFGGCEGLNRKHVRCTRLEHSLQVEFVSAICPGDLCRIGNPLAV